ncbi:MAG: amidohydrolase family protein [Gemmatimonadaceae bacterium]|nr:amidohydrolase family protein [Chitinophagaceae bacterium]
MRFLFILLALPVTAFCQQTDTTEYFLISNGEKKGFVKLWKNADASLTQWYQFNDRGRGDSIRVNFREDAESVVTYMSASGVDYFKNPVTEEFSLTDGKAKWKNISENEEKAVSGKAFYSGLKAEAGNIFRAMHANGERINLLPYGEAVQKVLQEHSVGKGAAAKKILLLEVKGFGLTPYYAWVDKDYHDFATVSDWRSLILKGYEEFIPELLTIKKKHEAEFFNGLGVSLPEALPAYLLIQDVSIFDAEKAITLTHKDILVHNGNVEKIAPANTLKQPGARLMDGKNKTVVPGLWDMHTHMGEGEEGLLHIAAGVTHIRDMGNGESLLKLSKSINDGVVIGPRVEIISGFIDGAGPMAAPTGKQINNVEEGIAAIREFAAKGYQQIKLYSSIKPEWVKPLAAEAHKNKMRVCGHIPAFMTASTAIAAGYDEVTHLNMFALNFFGDTVDTRIPLRFSIPAAKTAGLDLNGADMKKFIAQMKAGNIAIDPTLMVFESLFTARDNVLSPAISPFIDHFPMQMQRQFRSGGGGLPVPENMDTTFKNSFEAFKKITKMLFDNGIRILPGTDGMAGFDLRRELELYTESGIPAAKVLQMATWGAAQYTGKSNVSGKIVNGTKADFFIVEGNPAENIKDLRKTRVIVTNGKLYDAAKLYSSLSIKPL